MIKMEQFSLPTQFINEYQYQIACIIGNLTSNKLSEVMSNLNLEKEYTEDDLSLINQLVDGEELFEYSD